MNQDRLKYLFSQYFHNSITQVELKELFESIASLDSQLLTDLIEETMAAKPALLDKLTYTFNKDLVYHKIKGEISRKKIRKLSRIKSPRFMRIAAVSLLAFSLVGTCLYYNSQKPASEQHTDIQLPAQNHAAIHFSDGPTYVLIHSSEDSLRKRGIERIQQSNGELSYKIHSTEFTKNLTQTFYNPKGTSSQLILSDGTKVWLNSGSKIAYPSAFTAKERLVALQGEAYFDVTHKSSSPFIVDAQSSQVKVLGTQFNIATNLSPDNVLTSLISGSVQVRSAKAAATLSEGTQAATSRSSGEIKTYPINLKDITAWKEGYFRFKDDDIHQVLSKLKAWYSIEGYAVKEETIDRFTGSIVRTRKLSDLLIQLEKISNYKFKIIDGRIIVMK